MSKYFSDVRWLKSQPLKLTFSEDQIDEENGVIHDVVMCEVGPAKGHDVNLEQEFINDLVAYDQKFYTEIGNKARFGHPSMSDTTMGAQMGYFQNFRVRGNQAIGDLYLLDSADLSPTKPNMKKWVFSMAKEAPDFIMSSIVFKPGSYYQRNKDGEKRQIWYYKEVDDGEGGKVQKWISKDPELGDVFVGFGESGAHYYTDLVESGAATNNLFSQEFNSDKFAVKATMWLQDNTEILTFLKENPHKLVEFADGLGIEIPKKKLSGIEKWESLRTYIFGANEVPQMDEDKYIAIEQHQSALAELRSANVTLQNDLTRQEESFKIQIEELNKKIKELEEKPLADNIEIELGPASNEGNGRYHTSWDVAELNK